MYFIHIRDMSNWDKVDNFDEDDVDLAEPVVVERTAEEKRAELRRKLREKRGERAGRRGAATQSTVGAEEPDLAGLSGMAGMAGMGGMSGMIENMMKKKKFRKMMESRGASSGIDAKEIQNMMANLKD